MNKLPKVGIILLYLLTITFFSYADTGQNRVVRVGAFNYYPGIFKDKDGIVKGFYVDALADFGRRENIRFEYVYGSWSEGLERLKSGEVDVLTSVAYTPERAAYMDYTTQPLLTVWGELYVSHKSKIDGIREVQGKRIAVMKGDFNAQHFKELVKKFDITCEFIEFPGFDDVFKAVASQKVDAGVVNSTFGVAKQHEYGLRSTGVVFNPFDIFFTVAKGENKELLKILNSYLVDWRHEKNSVYNKARQKWSHGTTGTLQNYSPMAGQCCCSAPLDDLHGFNLYFAAQKASAAGNGSCCATRSKPSRKHRIGKTAFQFHCRRNFRS